ncbi:MAG: hypothetical protein ACK518_03535 [bacterium]
MIPTTDHQGRGREAENLQGRATNEWKLVLLHRNQILPNHQGNARGPIQLQLRMKVM